MTDPECPLTELPASQCACPNHRGGQTPGEEPIATVGQPFEARYPGRSECCEQGIREGDLIARTWDGPDYVHAGRCPR